MAITPNRPARAETYDPSTGESPSGLLAQAIGSNPKIPDYELLRTIGHGAYGVVWLARNVTGSFVAVKVVARGAFDHDRPFEREFEGIKRFEPISRSDPSQVAILHVGRGEGFFYYVMELAESVKSPKAASPEAEQIHQKAKCETESNSELRAKLQRPASVFDVRALESYVPHTLREDLKLHGRLPASECVKIGLTLTHALAHLHRCGLVHRDVKASNVIFVGGVPKLADIGLVTSVDATRSLVGTEGYVAPEGAGTPQADIYSLGKLLYEISTGCDRKEFPTLPADIAMHPDRGALIELNAIITRACQFDPGERYANAEAMLMELELLERGRSVQRKRKVQQGLRALRKIGIALAGTAPIAAVILLLTRGVVPYGTSPEGPPSTNADANLLWEQGMSIVRYDRYGEFPQAYTNFQRAIKLDPNYVRPYVGLLELRYRQYVPSMGLTSEEELRTIAENLKRLSPNLAATHVAQSAVNWADWNYPQAQDCLLRAIKADPNYELAHTTYAFKLALWGYPKEARAQLALSEKLRPSKATVYRVRAQTYYVQRDYTNAMAWARKALECDPHESVAFYTIGCAYRALGDYSKAVENLERATMCEFGDRPEIRTEYAQFRQALEEGGPQGYWRQFLQQTAVSEFYWKAVAQVHLGNMADALKWLEKSCDVHERWSGLHDGSGSHDGPLSYLILDQDWDDLHNNPRFRAVLDKIGFTRVKPAQ